MIWCLLGVVGAQAGVEADEGSRDRLARRTERKVARTTRREVTFASACAGLTHAPDDPKAQRGVKRAEMDLIGARARSLCLESRLDAWDTPERLVRLLYATNRTHDARKGYVSRDADRVEYGVATVRIPAAHPRGELERDLAILSVKALTVNEFREVLAAETVLAGPDAQVLTYVHGYNNSFEYAARRTVQLANDTHDALVPVLFSWPASGGTWLSGLKYTFDENAAARSAPLFAEALETLVDAAADAPVTLLAHSMGTRVVADGLLDLGVEFRESRPLERVVLAAPDVDASVFARRYLVPMLEASHALTVYCATDDRALGISRSVHGGYDRLGSCRDSALTRLDAPGVEIVDASKLWVNLLDHDKVAGSTRLLSDLAAVMGDVPASDPSRGLVEVAGRFELPP